MRIQPKLGNTKRICYIITKLLDYNRQLLEEFLNESGNNCFVSEDSGQHAIAWNSKKFEKLDSGKQEVDEDTKAK